MPEETPVVPDSLGWRAGLPDDLKTNEAFVPYKTVGEFAKSHLELATKAKEMEGKLGDAIPKLPDDASDEERGIYYDALGRPKQSSEYEFEGEDKNAPEWTSQWKQTFHSLGLNKSQAKSLSAAFNSSMQQMVDAHNTKLKNEMTAAETKLKSEMGDKYDTNVELAKRMHQKHLGTEFDKDFSSATPEQRFGMTRLLLKIAALTGEDRSPTAGRGPGTSKPNGMAYPNSSMPPARSSI